MNITRIACCGIALLGLVGCSAVYLEEPIGSEVVRIEEGDWEGTWVAADGDVATIGVRDADAGTLWVADVGKHGDEMKMESLTVHVRDASRGGRERLFISVEDDGAYFWGLVVRDQDYVVLYAPEIDRFRDMVNEGRLPGRIGDESDLAGSDVYLGKLAPEHLDLILSDDAGTLFAWDRPYVLRRVSR